MFFVDAHCHINSRQLRTSASSVVSRAAAAGVRRMLTVGSDLPHSAEAVELASLYGDRGVYATVGVHPHDAAAAAEGLPDELLKLAESREVVAIGETGLDYYYDHSSRNVQRDVFRMHVEWAANVNKPLVLHVRNAEGDTLAMDDALAILDGMPEKPALMFHCYAGGLRYMDAMKKLDAYISIAGPVTWPKGGELRAVAAAVPEGRLLCETDSPWLSPQPHRGKLNEPAYVRFVYEAIAEARGLPLDDLARIVDANAARLFGWEPLYVRV
ncbi:MAG: TatD family hydrolase [Synergistaceae bacterium]|nr:TatD family hydrolase [Synergistaceae bacterium]